MRNECEWFDHGADIGTRGLGATEAATFEMEALALAAVITDPRRVEPRDEVSLRCHGAGRALSRHAATKRWGGRKIVDELAGRGILIRTPSLRGVAEEAPLAYKDVSAVVDSADKAGLAKKGARQEPMVCIKGLAGKDQGICLPSRWRATSCSDAASTRPCAACRSPSPGAIR